MKYPKLLLAVSVLLVTTVGCTSAELSGGPQDNQVQNSVHFLKQKPSDAPDMEALLEGKLVLSEMCLYIRSEDVDSTYAAIWPFEFSLHMQGDSIQILNGNENVVAQVGDQIRVSGGEAILSPEQFEQNVIGTATQCTAPYWRVNNDVEVVAP